MKKNDSGRRRGRPPSSHSRKPVIRKEQPKPQSVQKEQLPEQPLPELQPFEHEQLADEGPLSNFATLLTHILKRDRTEITRIAQELEVAEHTVYRWMNGTSRPRPIHFKRLLEALPEHNNNLVYAINHTFPGALDSFNTGIREVQKDIYTRVMELVATTSDDEARTWQITQTVFEHALLHLDSDRKGLAVTFARFMPAHEDGIHSLYEAFMRGNYPWPYGLEVQAFLGSNTLAGAAALSQRWQTWDDLDETTRLRVVIDDFEKSACAYPVFRNGRMGGVLLVSSTNPNFFNDFNARRAVVEYAQLIGLALPREDFHRAAELNLRPMPDLRWQREEISRTGLNRIIAYARKYGCSSAEAEVLVRRDLELEFEERAQMQLEQRRREEDEAFIRIAQQNQNAKEP